MTSASQAKAPISTAGQSGRVVTVVNASTAGGTLQKLQGNGVTVNASAVPTAVVSAAHIQTSPQTKVLMHMTGQMTVNQARNAVRTGKTWLYTSAGYNVGTIHDENLFKKPLYLATSKHRKRDSGFSYVG